MKPGITRSILRWIHLILSIPIAGYIYSPGDKIPQYAPATRFFLSADCPFGLIDVERPSARPPDLKKFSLKADAAGRIILPANFRGDQ